jgi:hypothetical protein
LALDSGSCQSIIDDAKHSLAMLVEELQGVEKHVDNQ